MSDPIDEMFNGPLNLNEESKEDYDFLYRKPDLPEEGEQAPTNTNETSQEQESSTEEQSENQGIGKTFAETKPSVPNYLASAGAGVVDFGIGLINKIPKKNLPGVHNPFHNEQDKVYTLPEYQDESLQAVRDISSLIVPTLWLNRFFVGRAQAADKALKWKLGQDKFVQWLGRTGIAVGTGVLVDEIAPVQERDHNAAGWLKTAWPKTWGWVPDDWATLDNDSPEVKRQKNRNEGAAIGFLSDLIAPAGRFIHARSKLKEATKWVPNNEKASSWLNKKNNLIKLSDDPIENDLLQSAKKRDDQLTELGKAKVEDGVDITVPQKGVHDAYDWTETGVRTSDDGGIVSAGIDQARIVKQIDTRYGRIGSILSPKTLRDLLTGKENPVRLFKNLGKTLKETDIDYVGSKGRVVKHADSLREAEALGAALYNTDLDGMKAILKPLSRLDPQTGSRKLSNQAYKGVMQAIKKYSDDFINLDSIRAQGLTGTSVAGQISDMAEGARLMDGTPAVDSSYDQILDRLEFLMNLQGQTTYLKKEAIGLHDILNRIKRAGNDLNPSSTVKSIKEESNSTLQALEDIANSSRNTIETLRQVKAERPQMLAPLMLAYELTDGKIASISALNKYIRNTTGTISKAFFDAQADMPSAWTQGVWANIYNSVLSAVGTPLKAALSNTVLMIERPLSTFAGALAHGNWAVMRRAHYMYNVGIAETFQRSLSHMNQIYKRATVDPSSVGYIMRDDIARKNEAQLDLMRSFSNAAEEEGNFGPSILTNHIETLNDLSEHPVLRFSANAMTAFDGFTRSFIGNIEARGRAYDKLMSDGTRINSDRVRAMARNVYSEMFDETGMITDKAVEYASREIAMNLDNSAVSALNEMVKMVPAIKPFMMFPKTSINMMRFAGSHSPSGLFLNQLNDFSLPFSQMNIEDAKQLLSKRGVGNVGNVEAAYDTIRAELKGRKAIGTLMVSGGALLFTQDRLTGNGIYDKTRQRARRENDWKPKHYKGWDGKWYSYENLGPITDWLALTADIMDNYVDGTLDEPTTEIMFNKMGFLLSANLTDKSFTAGLEPLGDVLAGNPAAASRWAGSFGSALLPGSGFRNELARLLDPQLKEVDQELNQIIANRNPILKGELPDLYDWMDGSKVGEPTSFFTRIWNTYSPLWKVSEAITPEKQFLIDIEFDGRPSLRTNGHGVEYTPEQRSEVTRLMGESKIFRDEVRRIMRSKDGKEFRKQWKELANSSNPIYLDRKLQDNIQVLLYNALKQSQRWAESQLSDYDEIREQQWANQEIDRATRTNDVERILELQNR